MCLCEHRRGIIPCELISYVPQLCATCSFIFKTKFSVRIYRGFFPRGMEKSSDLMHGVDK
jgi:hypothetical protein